MGDLLLRTGDLLKITMSPPTVVPIVANAIPLRGSSLTVRAVGDNACLKGDELPDALKGPVDYTAPPFSTPGVGTFQLPAAQFTRLTKNGTELLLRGAVFPVIFAVSVPAMQPTAAGPIPDPAVSRPGTGQFITRNATVRLG
jgi:hypothetical protein